MSTFSGRRNTGTAKRIGKGLLEGLSAIGTVMADGPKVERIKEIDTEMERLQHEKDSLIASLIEPGEYKVSDSYDPHRIVTPLMDQYFGKRPGEGRLTKCKGRNTSSRYHDAHPGCPYVEQIHTAHEFTLRD